jgi:hypothetical protein
MRDKVSSPLREIKSLFLYERQNLFSFKRDKISFPLRETKFLPPILDMGLKCISQNKY